MICNASFCHQLMNKTLVFAFSTSHLTSFSLLCVRSWLRLFLRSTISASHRSHWIALLLYKPLKRWISASLASINVMLYWKSSRNCSNLLYTIQYKYLLGIRHFKKKKYLFISASNSSRENTRDSKCEHRSECISCSSDSLRLMTSLISSRIGFSMSLSYGALTSRTLRKKTIKLPFSQPTIAVHLNNKKKEER
jgi:hypothetical protein